MSIQGIQGKKTPPPYFYPTSLTQHSQQPPRVSFSSFFSTDQKCTPPSKPHPIYSLQNSKSRLFTGALCLTISALSAYAFFKKTDLPYVIDDDVILLEDCGLIKGEKKKTNN